MDIASAAHSRPRSVVERNPVGVSARIPGPVMSAAGGL